jgi:hypothetical protein
MPADAWQDFSSTHPGAFGLGVLPDSRDPLGFFEELSAGVPAEGRDGSASSSRLGALGRALAAAGVVVGVADGGPPDVRRALNTAFGPAPTGYPSNPRGYVRVVPVDSARAAVRAIRGTFPRLIIVIGIGPRSPVWIELCPERCEPEATPGLLSDGIARRPAIVTPYDLARTIYDEVVPSAEPTTFDSGDRLSTNSNPSALAHVRSIAASLERDAGIGHAVGGVTVSTSIAAAMIGLTLLWSGRNRWALRAALASWAANVGYIVALFFPTGSGGVRALIMLAVMAGAAALPVRGSPRLAARYAFGVTAVFWLAALLAPLRPGGLPGTAIWGNPLVSWRFFGLQNFEAGLLACGVVLWGVIAGFGPRVLTTVAIAAGVVIAAPTIGANYVGLLTFAFGAWLAILALARKRYELWHVLAAGGIAAAGFVLSLLADTGSPVSHGGRAAERISQGGVSVLWEFIHRRLRLNLDLIRTFPIGTGFVLFAAMLVVIFFLFRWGTRPGQRWPGGIAVWAGAAMALSSLVLEDSGFYSGAVIFVIVVCGYIVASGEPDPALSPPIPAPSAGDG